MAVYWVLQRFNAYSDVLGVDVIDSRQRECKTVQYRIWLTAGRYKSIALTIYLCAVALSDGPAGLKLCSPSSRSKPFNLLGQNNHELLKLTRFGVIDWMRICGPPHTYCLVCLSNVTNLSHFMAIVDKSSTSHNHDPRQSGHSTECCLDQPILRKQNLKSSNSETKVLRWEWLGGCLALK